MTSTVFTFCNCESEYRNDHRQITYAITGDLCGRCVRKLMYGLNARTFQEHQNIICVPTAITVL